MKTNKDLRMTAEAIAFEKSIRTQYDFDSMCEIVYPVGMLISTVYEEYEGQLLLRETYAGRETYCHIYGDHGQTLNTKEYELFGPLQFDFTDTDPCPF